MSKACNTNHNLGCFSGSYNCSKVESHLIKTQAVRKSQCYIDLFLQWLGNWSGALGGGKQGNPLTPFSSAQWTRETWLYLEHVKDVVYFHIMREIKVNRNWVNQCCDFKQPDECWFEFLRFSMKRYVVCGQLYLLTDGVFWSGSFMPVGMFVAFFGA